MLLGFRTLHHKENDSLKQMQSLSQAQEVDEVGFVEGREVLRMLKISTLGSYVFGINSERFFRPEELGALARRNVS